jgi:hypothetical protein
MTNEKAVRGERARTLARILSSGPGHTRLFSKKKKRFFFF